MTPMTSSSPDPIFDSFLDDQQREAQALADASDILTLHRLDAQRYVAEFACRTLVRRGDQEVAETTGATVGIHLHDGYLREPNPVLVISWFGPRDIWHPNIAAPLACIGEIRRGEPLTDLLYRCYEVASYQNYGTLEYDALNRAACVWARHNAERLPVDDRPLRRRQPEPSPATAATDGVIR